MTLEAHIPTDYARRTLFHSLLANDTRSALGGSSETGSGLMNLLMLPPFTSTPLSAAMYRRMPFMNDFSRNRMPVLSRSQTPVVHTDSGPVRGLCM